MMRRWSIGLAVVAAASSVDGLQPRLAGRERPPYVERHVAAALQGGPPPLEQYVAAALQGGPPLLEQYVAAALQGGPPPQAPRGQRPDLKRPTKKDDEVPPFDYDRYFPGAWSFEWRVPESPLGSAGTIKGTEVFSPGTGGDYESTTEASGPDGDFTVRSTITYDPAAKLFTRRDRDSRGFEIVWRGAIGGDLGGFYTIHYESAPFTHKGQSIRLKMTTRLVSPLNYKVQAQMAVDGAEYTAFGNPWWEKGPS